MGISGKTLGDGNRHVLVVGGAGYIGSVLTRRLLARGARVRCLDALLYGNEAAVTGLLSIPAFSFVRGDLCDRHLLHACLDGITDVVLLAALVGDPICRRYADLAREINLRGSIGVFDALRHRPVRRFVFASTCSNYGIHRGAPAGETCPLDPRSTYAQTKVAFEEYVLSQAPSDVLSPTVLRLATAFGLSPRMRFDLTVSEFTRELALGRELVVYDPGTWRPYCHVSDIADAMVAVLEADAGLVSGQVFNVGSDAENYTKAMIVSAVTAVVPSPNVRFVPGGVDLRDYRVSFERVRTMLGFTPKRTVGGGVAELAGALRAGGFADVDLRREFYGNRSVCLQPAEAASAGGSASTSGMSCSIV